MTNMIHTVQGRGKNQDRQGIDNEVTSQKSLLNQRKQQLGQTRNEGNTAGCCMTETDLLEAHTELRRRSSANTNYGKQGSKKNKNYASLKETKASTQ